MTFKKDYINYLLYTVVNSPLSEFRENYRLRKLVDSIIAHDDIMKVTYVIGKTAGLDLLFKYMLYISDKIDKSQVTIFNLKDNFDYDKQNLEKICSKIDIYKSESVQDAIKNITETHEEKPADETSIKESKDKIIIDTTEDEKEIKIVELEEFEVQDNEEDSDAGLTLIENPETYTGEAEVFELDSISESVENSDKIIDEKIKVEEEESKVTDDYEDVQDEEFTEELNPELTEEVPEGKPVISEETDEYKEEIIEGSAEDEIPVNLPDLEIEVHKPMGASQEVNIAKEEAITNEAYYKFETKFFEEVKILEKLLASVLKECVTDNSGKLTEKCLQGMTEILGITSELSSLSRQLSFDLIADIFLTMNIYFTRSISQPELLINDRIKLFDASLALVNSLIKGEDYLNYDTIVERIEKLKKEISGEKEEDFRKEEITQTETVAEKAEDIKPEENEGLKHSEQIPVQSMLPEDKPAYIEKPALKKSQLESAVFKLKYLIKEFEKSFSSISELKGEYSRFDALEKISELNNALRLIAKISAAIKYNDVLKLAEVTYVFLKYVKDYRMDMQEPEVQQIMKYIIFTFKMLLTNRKPEDFNVLVQHLNNPVKIFADS